MAELQTEITPSNGEIGNSVPGAVRVSSPLTDNTLIVTDETTLLETVNSLTHTQFNGKVFKYREKIAGTNSKILNSDMGPLYRIPTVKLGKDGVVHICGDVRFNGRDEYMNEIVYARSIDGGKTFDKKVIGHAYTGAGHDAERTRVMDPTLLDAGNGNLFCLAGRWIKGDSGWTKNNGTVNSANTWSAALLMKSTDNGLNWSQHTIGKATCDSQEGTHITVQNLRSNCKGFLGGVDAGLKHSSGKLIFGIQFTTGNNDAKSTLLISEDGGANWRMAGGDTGGVNYECSILELADGAIVLHCRSEDSDAVVENQSRKKAFITRDFGETWEVYAPLSGKVGATTSAGSVSGRRCEGGTERGLTISGKEFCIAAYPQVDLNSGLGHSAADGYSRDQITLYACNLNNSTAKPIGMLQYRGGPAPVSGGGISWTEGIPYGGYSSIDYGQTLDGEYLIAVYEDELGISIRNISDLLPRLESYCNEAISSSQLESEITRVVEAEGYVKNDELTSAVEAGISSSAETIVKNLTGKEIDYIGKSTLGPVNVVDVIADFTSVTDLGEIVDIRSGVKYPKTNTGTTKPVMGTEENNGLIVYNSRSTTAAEKAYTVITSPDDNSVLGLPSAFTVAFEFRYQPASGDANWIGIFRAYKDHQNYHYKSNWIFGVNVGNNASGNMKNGKMVFNPWVRYTNDEGVTVDESSPAPGAFVMNASGASHGDRIHYCIVVKSNGRQFHYINGVEVNSSTAVPFSDSKALPAPGAGFMSVGTGNIKQLAMCVDMNNISGNTKAEIGFGNLKFYNKELTGDEVKELYSRRKEYLPALETEYKDGFVGAINELKKNIESGNGLESKVDLLMPLVGQLTVLGSKIPEAANLIVNLNSTVFKSGLTKTGYAYDFESTVRDVRDLNFYVDNNTPKTTFGTNKNSSYNNSDVSYNSEIGYLYVGKDKRKTVIDLSQVGLLNGSEGFTIEVEIEKLDNVEAAWAGFFLVSNAASLPSTGGGGNYNWNEGSNKNFRIEPKTNGASASFAVYSTNMNLNNVAVDFKPNLGNNGRIKAVFTLDSSNDFKAYCDYSGTASNTSTQVNGMEGVRYIAFNHGYADGNGAKCCNMRIHKLRIWKGVALTGAQVQELANH